VGAGGIWRQREQASLLSVLLKLTLVYGKGGACGSHPMSGRGVGGSQPGEGGP
jgi:hypothetical protein